MERMIKPQMSTVAPDFDLSDITARITELTVLAVHEHLQALSRSQAEVLMARINAGAFEDGAGLFDGPDGARN
jgi:hypothetical protein